MRILAITALFTLGLGVAQASDFVGAYGLIDKVTFEPNAEKPERVIVSGVFSLADPNNRNGYLPPQRGYLYFVLGPPDVPEWGRTLMEWNDLKAVAGSHKVVSLGSRNSPAPRVRKENEKPSAPDRYSVGYGLTMNSSNTDYPPVKSLLDYR